MMVNGVPAGFSVWTVDSALRGGRVLRVSILKCPNFANNIFIYFAVPYEFTSPLFPVLIHFLVLLISLNVKK